VNRLRGGAPRGGEAPSGEAAPAGSRVGVVELYSPALPHDGAGLARQEPSRVAGRAAGPSPAGGPARPRFGGVAEALFSLSGPTAVSAGAGSGKTTCLVELCLRLFSGEAAARPVEPAEVVAITFTEKAALELEERLREGLARRAATAPADEVPIWQARLHGLERMAIGTIHGFARRLLREHALEAGLDPEFEVLDEEAARSWRREAARGAVVAALDRGRPEVRELCAAYGASGRRGGLAEVVSEIVRERAALGETEAMAPAATPRAEALEARERMLAALAAALGQGPRVRSASGARALARLSEEAARLEEADRRGPLRPATLARASLLAAALRGWRGGTEEERVAKAALAEACEAFLLRAAEVLAGPQKDELCRLVAEVEGRYAARKSAARVLDFDDLLARARDLLEGQGAVRAEVRGRLFALLVDEYQDVNALQHAIFELLTGGEEGPVLVAVGDLKQSIYRFRGADVAVFRRLIEGLPGRPGGRVLHLAQNYRSGPAVLELVNEVSARSMKPGGGPARPYELAFGEEDRLVPVRVAGAGPACEILPDPGGEGGLERREREARAVAERIVALVSGRAGVEVGERPSEPGGEERRRRPGYADVGLLFRRLTQVGAYERALRQAGIPYRLARGGGFYQAPEVRDLGELLASLAHPEDALAWAAVLRSPLCGLSEAALFGAARLGFGTLARRAPQGVVEELLAFHPPLARPWPLPDLPSTEADRLRLFLTEWQALRALEGRLSVPGLLRRALDRLDLEAAHLASPDGERRVGNLRKAVLLAERFAGRGGTAAEFAEQLRTMAARPPSEPEAELEAGEAVALLSVHQAKGLEWPIVFLPDLGTVAPVDARRALRGPAGELVASYYEPGADLHYPTAALAAAREESRRAAAAESRRLLYVALTRARDHLVLSGEARRGDSWRGLVEEALAARPELALRLSVEVGETAAPHPEPEGAAEPEGLAEAWPTFRVLPPPTVQLAVTELAEQRRCPRRLFFARELALPEAFLGRGSTEDDPERATARGTLAHAMLAETDLAAPPLERHAQLAAAALRAGYDPSQPHVRRIMGDVTRFLESPPGRPLARAARAGTLRREVPFLLKLGEEGAPACYLSGALDALVDDGRRLEVIDFKYALARPGAGERYRLQLLAYVLAASRALPGRRVTARLQFLRGGCQSLDLTPSEAELERFAREAPRLAAAASAGLGRDATPAELGRDERRCRLEGCGYLSRCYPRPRASRGPQALGTGRGGQVDPALP